MPDVCARMCVIIIDSTLFPYECMCPGYENSGVQCGTTFAVVVSVIKEIRRWGWYLFLLLRRLIARKDKDKSFFLVAHMFSEWEQNHSEASLVWLKVYLQSTEAGRGVHKAEGREGRLSMRV